MQYFFWLSYNYIQTRFKNCQRRRNPNNQFPTGLGVKVSDNVVIDNLHEKSRARTSVYYFTTDNDPSSSLWKINDISVRIIFIFYLFF